MSLRFLVLPLVLVPLVLAGCPATTNSTEGSLSNGSGTTSTGSSTTDTGGTATDTGGTTTGTGGQGSSGQGSNGATTGSTTGTGPGTSTNAGGTSGAVAITGRINPGQAAKARPRMQSETYPYTVVAQSNQTGELYRGATDGAGDFSVDLPESEAGHTFGVTILGPDGRAVGPVLMDKTGDQGVTGVALDHVADLGTIALPADPTKTAISPGTDSNVSDIVDPNLTARLNADGAPVGLATHGKGSDAATGQPGTGLVDADHDGLIDVFDADDNGNGTIDDFDSLGGAAGQPTDYHVNFFMNLKIGAEQAPVYYTGAAADVETHLATETVITFEVMMEPTATRHITAAQLLETPGPSYLPIATKTGAGSSGTLWKNTSYAFDMKSDRWDAFAIPNAEMQAGDTFTLEVSFDDGKTEQYSRMINYVFKNIPKLLQYGTAGALVAFNVLDPNINGAPSKPILFDSAQDLTLVFQPPPDETGAPITGMDYTFQIFYMGDTGQQLNGQIDTHATWPTPIAGQQNTTYYVHKADLGTLPTDGTYTVTLPSELFPSAVTLLDASTAAISQFKIDITAEAPTGNAAIMLVFQP
jgi:hypothetical protein